MTFESVLTSGESVLISFESRLTSFESVLTFGESVLMFFESVLIFFESVLKFKIDRGGVEVVELTRFWSENGPNRLRAAVNWPRSYPAVDKTRRLDSRDHARATPGS